MEYTKDMILQVNYGQEAKKQKNRGKIFDRLSNTITRHKIMMAIISMTLMLMILDFMLVATFVQLLSSI